MNGIAFIPVRNTKTITKTCDWAECGAEFKTQHSYKRFCQRSCNVKYQKAKEKAEKAKRKAPPPNKKEIACRKNARRRKTRNSTANGSLGDFR